MKHSTCFAVNLFLDDKTLDSLTSNVDLDFDSLSGTAYYSTLHVDATRFGVSGQRDILQFEFEEYRRRFASYFLNFFSLLIYFSSICALYPRAKSSTTINSSLYVASNNNHQDRDLTPFETAKGMT